MALGGTTPSVSTWIDATAAIVPAEVLALHGAILTFTTAARTDGSGQATVVITSAGPLALSFWALSVMAVVFYLFGRQALPANWRGWVRALLPALAFVGWTMLQKGTAFDAVAPAMDPALRGVIALLGGALIVATAKRLA